MTNFDSVSPSESDMNRFLNFDISTLCSKKPFRGFGRGYAYGSIKDLRSLSKALPEGIAICSSSLVAGVKHLESVLRQSAEYWDRHLFLARNRSIDLLMRLTCQRQISKALELSQLEGVRKVALFGLTTDVESISLAENMLDNSGAKSNNRILELDPGKTRLLMRLHSLPDWVSGEKLESLLQERAVSLNFSK